MFRFLAPLAQRRTYVETADVVLDLVVGVASFSIFTTLVATGASLLITIVGLPILTATFYLVRVAAALERGRARVFLATEIAAPIRAPARGESFLQRLATPFRDRTTWKELLYVWLVQPVQAVVGFTVGVTAWLVPLWAVTLPVYAAYAPPELWNGEPLDAWYEVVPIAVGGLVLLPLAPWVVRFLAGADRATARWGLTPRSSVPVTSIPTNEGGTNMPRQSHNLAARMGRWSAAHWKTAAFGWLALVVVAFGIGGLVGTKNVDTNAAGPGESGRMNEILDDGFKQPAGETVLIQSASVRVGDPAFTAAIEDVVARVSKLPAVQNVRSPLASENAGQIAKGGDAALVEFDIRGESKDAGDKVGPVVDAVAAAQRAHPGFFIGEFGGASAAKATEDLFADDLGKAGLFSLPITLIILVVAFGALVAAGIPLLLALTAVFATFGLAALPSQVLPLALEAPAVVLLIGLAVGVDYSMFYLKRERQERAAGRSERAALEAAAATSGRSVLVSGLTVMVAMAGLFLTGDATFASFGYATMIVVAVAVLGSLTVLPALLARLGDGVDRLRVPLVGRLRRDDGEGRIWGAIVDRVLRRPLLSAVLSGGLVVALALPALQLRIATPRPEAQFPKSLDIVKTYDRMQASFPGTALPANVVVKAPDVNAPAVRAAIEQLTQRARESAQMGEPITVEINADETVANITVPIAGTGTDPASNTALAELRDELVPETVGALPDTEAGVTGQTAIWKDTGDQMKSWLAPVVAFVLLFAFALILVAFRSLVIAVKAIVLNLLSVAAAYGVLVLVFQHGWGKGLLGFDETSGIEPFVPLLLFVILFGLSMDYHVFILSRIRETFDGGASMDDAVSHGIKSTAGVVTSAAVVMVAVFSVFGALSLLGFKQFGVGLAAAILIDATIVRAVLLPATMKLLGEWNWYLPSWLEWLPQLRPDEPSEAPEAPPVPAS